MTQRFALVGEPITHSPSPRMHNAGFAAIGRDACYELRPAGPADVPAIVAELERGVWQGLNVTTPLKTLLAPHVQRQGHAARAQAVNTLWRDSGQLCGALTDVDGIIEPLTTRGVRAGAGLVLGAGGASRAAVLALEALGLSVYVAARREHAALELLRELQPSGQSTALDLADTRRLTTLWPSLTVVLQATPIGRDGERHDLPWTHSQPGLIAFEMLYRPRRTPFLVEAQAAGLRTIEGWEMLLEQGVQAFGLWTGAQPREAMRAALLQEV